MQREAILLAHVHKLTYAEIAVRQGVLDTVAQTRLTTGLKRMRRAMQ